MEPLIHYKNNHQKGSP